MRCIELHTLVPTEQWEVYREVMRKAGEKGIPYAIGGALATGAYTDRWRTTKDVDLYILPQHRERMVEVFEECGLADYHEQVPYDRRWIYRGYKGVCIVDAIWAMANMRTAVDEQWLTRGREFHCDGLTFRVLPPEELIWSKLYVMQRERCDWPDVLNILYATSPYLDWHHLLERVGSDTPLLRGVLSIFMWLCPSCADYVPDGVRMQLDLLSDAPPPQPTPIDSRRVDLLDARPWFGPMAKAA